MFNILPSILLFALEMACKTHDTSTICLYVSTFLNGRLGLTIHRHHKIIKSPRKNAWPYSGGVIGVDNVAGVIWAL